MEIEARRFNSDGIKALKDIFEMARSGITSSAAAKFTQNDLEAVTQLAFEPNLTEPAYGFVLHDDRKFSNRFELGKYLADTIPSNSAAGDYENVGFWSWISAVYIDQILKPNKGGKTFQLWTSVRYIPQPQLSKRRYYRHLTFLPYWICKMHAPETAEFFLMRRPYEHSDIIEQLYTSDENFTPYPGVIDVAKRLYIDKANQNYRPNVTGRATPGSAVRLAQVICKQWQLNYDLHALTADQIWQLLPAEFNGWKRQAKQAEHELKSHE